VYLIDTNVISEARKKSRANPGVIGFLAQVSRENQATYLSSITIGELRRGLELMQHRGDADQSLTLQKWLDILINQYRGNILDFDLDAAQVWGRLRVPNPENELDKQIAAIALVHDLIVVTRNVNDFTSTGVKLFNPFTIS